jgi:uncharacterized protein (DUF3820 family)
MHLYTKGQNAYLYTLTYEFRKLKKLVTVTMPYGKYKGRIIADLPEDYLNWFARKGFPSG